MSRHLVGTKVTVALATRVILVRGRVVALAMIVRGNPLVVIFVTALTANMVPLRAVFD